MTETEYNKSKHNDTIAETILEYLDHAGWKTVRAISAGLSLDLDTVSQYIKILKRHGKIAGKPLLGHMSVNVWRKK